MRYPAADPGPARTTSGKRRIRVENDAFAMTWSLDAAGLRPELIHDRRTGRKLALQGELFQIILTDGQRYVASALVREGPPQRRRLAPDPGASRLAARLPGRQIELPLKATDGRLRVVWRALIHDGANCARQELSVTALRDDCVIQEIVWLNETIPGARTAGRVDGSPIVAGNFFLGLEDPHALNVAGARQPDFGGHSPAVRTAGPSHPETLSTESIAPSEGDAAVICRLRRDAVLRPGETWSHSFVAGVAPAGQMRRAFLYYLERERAHPYRPFLHYNSWYDTAWAPFALNEANCLEAIRLCGERFVQRHGVVMDALVFDDGWDDPKTLWQFHAGFPHRFAPLAELARQYGTRLGVWLSPFGGYGEPKEQRIRFGREQGFEINPTGFSLAGTNYYAAFRRACVEMIRQYGVNHFKFDGIAAGMYASGGAEYLRDTEAMRRLMLELRQEDPNLYINLTTGSWPSPFWLRYADSLWRQGQDMGHAGKGTRQQQWLTYRDQEVYRNMVGKGPLYPLNSLMTQGVAYSKHGMAGDPTFNSAGFKDDVRAFFGSGTGLQELYIQPAKLTSEDWRVLAEAARWSRANADVLVDTHWIGGDPGQLEVYGYASWTPRQGILMLRNPDDQPREFSLDVGLAFELPRGARRSFRLISPWTEAGGGKGEAFIARAGQPRVLMLQPFELRVFDALPVDRP